MHRRTRSATLGKLPEVTVRPILLLAKLVDYLRMARNLLFHADHAQVRAQPGR